MSQYCLPLMFGRTKETPLIFHEAAREAIVKNDLAAYVQVVKAAIAYAGGTDQTAEAHIAPFFISTAYEDILRQICAHALALERNHEIVGNNILLVDQKGRGKTHLMRAMTVGLGLVVIKLLPIYVDFASSRSSPAAAVRKACLQLGNPLPDLDTEENEDVAYPIQYARRIGLYPFFFLDEVDTAYPHLPHLWKQGADIGKIGGCSAVAAGCGALLRVKAFGDNAELKSCGHHGILNLSIGTTP